MAFIFTLGLWENATQKKADTTDSVTKKFHSVFLLFNDMKKDFDIVIPPIRPSKKIFVTFYQYLLNQKTIVCLYGAFLENSLSKQNLSSPHMLAVCMQGEGESLSFFSRASCTVHGFA